MKSWLSTIFGFWIVGLTLCLDVDGSAWENTHYNRIIDLSKSYVKESSSISIKNLMEIPQDVYYFRVNDGIGAVKNLSVIAAVVDGVAVELAVVGDQLYKLQLPIPIAPKSSAEIKVQYAYTGNLEPLPSKIDMDDKQSLLVRFNKFAYSDYISKEYTLFIGGIPKGKEVSLNDYPINESLPVFEPKIADKTIVYGPLLEDLQPLTIQGTGFLYEHNRPLAKVNKLNRSIWLPASDVDQVSFEEYYELTNDAAELKSGFSRVDYMKGRYEQTRNHFALARLEIPFTPGNEFEDYYFTDLVGIVSTHATVQDHLVLLPRFPIFGGWNYNFTLGWNNKLGNFVHKLTKESDTYIVRVPLINSIRDITYDDVYVSFYLPENAEFVNVTTAIDYELIAIGNELSYFDVSEGHNKITLHFVDLFDDLCKTDIMLIYKYTQASFWKKVLKISGFVFTALTGYYLLSLIDISIEKEKSE